MLSPSHSLAVWGLCTHCRSVQWSRALRQRANPFSGTRGIQRPPVTITAALGTRQQFESLLSRTSGVITLRSLSHGGNSAIDRSEPVSNTIFPEHMELSSPLPLLAHRSHHKRGHEQPTPIVESSGVCGGRHPCNNGFAYVVYLGSK